jgi:hypothetical protein
MAHRAVFVPHHRLLAGGQDQLAQQRRNRHDRDRVRPGARGILAQKEAAHHQAPRHAAIVPGVRRNPQPRAGRHDKQRPFRRHAEDSGNGVKQLRPRMAVPAGIVAGLVIAGVADQRARRLLKRDEARGVSI